MSTLTVGQKAATVVDPPFLIPDANSVVSFIITGDAVYSRIVSFIFHVLLQLTEQVIDSIFCLLPIRILIDFNICI
jgi:hypothetical protein